MRKEDLTLANITKIAYNALSKIGCSRAGLILQNTLKNLVTTNPSVTTLAICARETIYVSPKFWEKNLLTEEDAEQVVLHEVFHSILGDTARLTEDSKHRTQLANIAADIRINHWIHSFDQYKDSFFAKFYGNKGLEKLLRPGSQFKYGEKFNALYSNVWNSNTCQDYDDIFDTLERMLPNVTTKIIFIGSHGATDEKGKPLPHMAGELENALRDEIIAELEKYSVGAGAGGNSLSRLIELLKTKQKISRKFLNRFAIDHNFNSLKSFFPVARKKMSPVPINPTQRDMFKAALGRPPIMWRAKATKINHKTSGVAIYVDLSGSVEAHLPRIIKLIANLNKELTSVFGFSTNVVEHSLKDMQKGKIDTTGGTSFDCVAEHILANNFTKFILITDACGKLNVKYHLDIDKQIKDACVVLFTESDRIYAPACWFSAKYKTITLDEVID